MRSTAARGLNGGVDYSLIAAKPYDKLDELAYLARQELPGLFNAMK